MGKNEMLTRGPGASALPRGLRAPEKRAPVGVRSGLMFEVTSAASE
jgi:hypothetical protein